jgi:hypothetical protein
LFDQLRQQLTHDLQRGGFSQIPVLKCTFFHQTPVLSGWISESVFENVQAIKEEESFQREPIRGRSVYPFCSVCSQPPTSMSNISSGTCVTCHQYLCPFHVSLHRKQKATAEHTIFSFAEVTDDSLKVRSRAIPSKGVSSISTEELEQRRTSVGSALSLSHCAVEVISQAARTLDIVHDSVELQCSRARAAIDASVAAATSVFNAALQRQRVAALQVVDAYHDSHVGQIAELHVALQEHSSSIEALISEAKSALQVVFSFGAFFSCDCLQADPETIMMSSLFIPALTNASFEAQACAKSAFSVHKVNIRDTTHHLYHHRSTNSSVLEGPQRIESCVCAPCNTGFR